MGRILLSISALLFIANVNAQRTFIKHFGTADSEYGTALVRDNSGILLGQIVASAGSVYYGLMKADLNGHLQGSRVYKSRDLNIIRSIHPYRNGYVMLANSWDSGSQQIYVQLIRVDALGDTIWVREYSASNSDLAAGLSVYADEIYVTAVADYNIGAVYPKLLWFKTDSNGVKLNAKMWSATYNLSPMMSAMNISGKMGIVCESNSFGIGAFNFKNLLVLQMDTAGNIDWTTSIGTRYDDEASDIASDGNQWVISGRSYFLNSAYDMSLFRVDPNGSMVFGHFYDAGTSDGEASRSVICRADHSCVVAGDAGTFNERNMFLTSISQNGDVNWATQYPISTLFTNYPAEVVELQNDSGFVFTGDLRPPAVFRDAALIRTDNSGQAGCNSAPLPITKLTDTVEVLTVSITPEPCTLNTTVPAWVDMNISIVENTICEFLDADFDYTTDTICPLLCFNFHDESVNATTWQWTFTGGDPATSSLQTPPQVCYETVGTYPVKLVAGDGITLDSITRDLVITSFCDTAIFFPNVITPNGDFANDQFEIKHLPENFRLMIYNRWGNLLFESSDKNKMWPEKPATDRPHDGVYYYILETFESSKNQKFKGYFSVLSNGK
jgi:gliding motility-associated-like protein